MPDRWKVIDCFQAALRMKNEHGFCILPFETVEDALELLKAQEPKKRESKAMLPCKCGCKRREHWFGGDDPEKFEMLKCSHCGFTAYGKNATDVIRNWNKAVRADADT